MLTLFAMGGGGKKGWGLVPAADSLFVVGASGIRESEIFREFLKFKAFGLKKSFFKNFVFKW